MTDIQMDEDFYVVFDETNDMGTVTGTEEFEQHMRDIVTAYFFEHIGDRNNSNVVRKLRIEAKRVADESDFVTSLDRVIVDNQEGETLSLTIHYNGDNEMMFEVI